MSTVAASVTPRSRESAFTRLEWTVIVVAGAAKLWLVQAWKLAAIGWAGHDDRWFLLAARSIMAGEWLGRYDEMTLIKGAGYPLLIAGISSAGVPLLLAQQLLYVLACVAVHRAVAPWMTSVRMRLALFLLLLFNPMSFSSEVASRVSREAVYPALTLLVFAGVAGTLFRLHRSRLAIVGWSLLVGVALAAFWHTREEGVWVLPFLACAALALVLRTRGRGLRYGRAVLAVSIPAVIFAAAWAAITTTNDDRYGVYTTVEFKQKAFLRAYGALTSVRQRPTVARVPVPKEVRERVYAVSPAFAELRPFLEGHIGWNWTRASHGYTPGEIGGGWFMWAFREAVAAAGYYRRGAPAVAAYYERIAREVEAARASGKLDARRNRESMVPALMAGERSAVAMTWLDGWRALATFAGFTSKPVYSSGSDRELLEFAETSRSRISPRESGESVLRLRVTGTVASAEGPVDLLLETTEGRPVAGGTVVQRRTGRTRGADTSEFELVSPVGDTWLVLSRGGRTLERVPLYWDMAGTSVAGVRLKADNLKIETLDAPPAARDAFRIDVMRRIAGAYQLLFAPFALVMALAFCWKLRDLVRTGAEREVVLLVTGLAGVIAARLLILSLIDVTSFPAMVGPYQGAAHVLLIVAVLLMAYAAATAGAFRRRSR